MATTKTATALRNSKLLAGIKKRYPNANLQSFPVGGSVYTLPEIVLELQALVDTASAVETARAALQAAIQANDLANTQTKPFVTALLQTTYAVLGNHPDALADCGLAPKKPYKPLTAAARVVAAAKCAATRVARNTMSKKKKLEIVGVVGETVAVSTVGIPAIVPPEVVKVAPLKDAGGGGAVTTASVVSREPTITSASASGH